MDRLKKFSTKQLCEELLCRENVKLLPVTNKAMHYMCVSEGINVSVSKDFVLLAVSRSEFLEK